MAAKKKKDSLIQLKSEQDQYLPDFIFFFTYGLATSSPNQNFTFYSHYLEGTTLDWKYIEVPPKGKCLKLSEYILKNNLKHLASADFQH